MSPDVLSFRTFRPSGNVLYVCLDVLSPQTFGLPDVLSRWTFCPSGRFVLDVLSLRTFCPPDVLSPTAMALDLVSPNVMSLDVLSSGRFVWAPLTLLDLKGTLTCT